MLAARVATIAWISGRQGVARGPVVLSSLLCLDLTSALIAEYGAEAFAARPTDTLSPSHLALFAIVLAFFAGAATIPSLRDAGRALYGLLASVGLGAVLWLLAPEFFTQPIGPIDPLYQAAHLDHIRELQPTFASQPGAGWLEWIATPVMRLGIAVPAIWIAPMEFPVSARISDSAKNAPR